MSKKIAQKEDSLPMQTSSNHSKVDLKVATCLLLLKIIEFKRGVGLTIALKSKEARWKSCTCQHYLIYLANG